MLKQNIFSENFIYKIYAKETVNFLKKKLLNKKKIKSKNLVVFDYGCGPCTIHKYMKFKKIYLYDIFPIKIKDKNRKFKIIRKFNEIKYINQNLDLIIINGVIQYMSEREIKNLISTFIPKLKYKGIIFFGDIPQHIRVMELFFLIFSPKIFLYIISYFFKKIDYVKLKYYVHSKIRLKSIINKNFKKKISLKFDKSSNVLFKHRYSCFLEKL
jgi:hypothetical protein